MCTHKTFKQQAKCKEYSKQSILDDIRDKASSPQKKKKPKTNPFPSTQKDRNR